ncbi:SAM-dependent methyltransferase [Gracilaria domingensis]|nr:SAM-dependent methyltransferase [Gracilaria domingensis]
MHQSRLGSGMSTVASSVYSEARAESVVQQMRHSGSFVREAWHDAIRNTEIRTVIDATAGRGSDTISLGQYVGNEGIVHAFDIQQDAIEETRQRYEEALLHGDMGVLCLHRRSHEDFSLLGLKEGSVSCVVYNLGWYPGKGADRSIITRESSTLRSLESAEGLVAVGGVVSIMAYVGHKGGKEEEEACLDWATGLRSRKWNVVVLKYPNRRAAPSLILCERCT